MEFDMANMDIVIQECRGIFWDNSVKIGLVEYVLGIWVNTRICDL
jgi:hypothetical protein